MHNEHVREEKEGLWREGVKCRDRKEERGRK